MLSALEDMVENTDASHEFVTDSMIAQYNIKYIHYA